MAIKKYAPHHLKLYNQDKIMATVKSYDENAKKEIILYGEKRDRTTALDTVCREYIGTQGHLEMLEQYPILQLGFNQDGTRKDLITLLNDRAERLANGEDINITNDLYKTLANKTNILANRGIKGEILDLAAYIKETGTDDEFVYDLLKDRLEMKNLTPEKIESLIQQQKKIAEERRKQLATQQNKGEEELQPEEQESIRDEVGDENKPKTQAQQQEQQQVEVMWQNRFQSWDRDVMTLPNGAKKKEEAVPVMQGIAEKKDKEMQKKTEQLEEQK